MSIFELMHTSAIAKELRCISQILDHTPDILDAVHRDLLQGRREDTGRCGLTADQVLRCAVLKQYRELTYEELAFYLEDSVAFRSFARLEMGVYPRKSILQDSIIVKLFQEWLESSSSPIGICTKLCSPMVKLGSPVGLNQNIPPVSGSPKPLVPDPLPCTATSGQIIS